MVKTQWLLQPLHRVIEQNRRAVGGKAHERHTGFVRNEAVADVGLIAKQSFAAVAFSHAQDDIRVLLPRVDDLLGCKADGRA